MPRWAPSDSALERSALPGRHREALALHWVLAQPYQLLHQDGSKEIPAGFEAAEPRSEVLSAWHRSSPSRKRARALRHTQGNMLFQALAFAFVFICCCQSRTAGSGHLSEKLAVFYEIAGFFTASWPQESVMQWFGSTGELAKRVNSSSQSPGLSTQCPGGRTGSGE